MYSPREDSFFLSSCIKEYLKENLQNKKITKNIKILDIGSGSGIQAETCRALGFENITATDIDPGSVELLKKKNFKTIKSNLFENIKEKFDLIIFNPPYLPKDKTGYDKEKDTTGGEKGYETILKFLKQAKSHLQENGEILLLFSSLSKPSMIKKEAKNLGYKITLLAEKSMFFEKLFVYNLKQSI